MSDDDFLNGNDFAELEADDFGASDFLDNMPEYLASEDDYSAYGDAGWQPESFEDFLAHKGKDIRHVSVADTWQADQYGRNLLDSFVQHVEKEESQEVDASAYYVPERQINQYGREYRPENQLLHDSKPENLNKTLMVAEARERMTQRNGESSNA